MPLTCDINKLVQQRITRDPAFADALLREGIDTMLLNDGGTDIEFPIVNASAATRAKPFAGPGVRS